MRGTVVTAAILLTACLATPAIAGPVSVTFTEDFSTTTFRDSSGTTATWSTAKRTLVLALETVDLFVSGANVSDDVDDTESVALGDIDGDGDLDLVAANDKDFGNPNRLYLNNSTPDPFAGVSSTDISDDVDDFETVALGDVNGDGDLDVVVGNQAAPNRLYVNNGTEEPFAGVAGTNITDDADFTEAVALGDLDGDGDLDLVVGNSGKNRLYLNNGTKDPFAGVEGTDISDDSDLTTSVALGDVDGDEDSDLVAGNLTASRVYLNNGTADPFGEVSGDNVGDDSAATNGVALGDVDDDGDLDIVTGNLSENRLHLNNGTDQPFSGVAGKTITDDLHETKSVALGDVDCDGDLDVVAGNAGENRLYLNNGTEDPFSDAVGTDITGDSGTTQSVALADVDGDSVLDLLAGNGGSPNRIYRTTATFAQEGQATSTGLTPGDGDVVDATLMVDETLPPNTAIEHLLTNDGGGNWHAVTPGEPFEFPAPGQDLRWRAVLSSQSPEVTPSLQELRLTATLTGTPSDFMRGHCNDDAKVDLSDAVCILGFLFLGDDEPPCVAATNVNDDLETDIADAVSLLRFLFVGGPDPMPPFNACGPGTSPADDALGCVTPPPVCGEGM